MARTPRSYTAHAGWSAISGRIRVVDYRRERRLIVSGAILSAYPLDGDWSTIEREYWWQGVARVRFPPHPRVLLVGLGGGTQAHLVHRLATPRLITAIERDPGASPQGGRLSATLINRPPAAFPGSEAFLEVPGAGPPEQALAVPQESIARLAGKSFVFVPLGERRYATRPIEAGRTEGGYVEVQAGLDQDERVVVGNADISTLVAAAEGAQ